MTSPSPSDAARPTFGVALSQQPLEPDGLIVTVEGELDIATAPALRERLTAALDGGIRRIVVDLSAVSFMDSVALAALVHAHRRLGEHGRMTVVLHPSSYTRLVFDAAGLDHCLDLADTREAAVARITA